MLWRTRRVGSSSNIRGDRGHFRHVLPVRELLFFSLSFRFSLKQTRAVYIQVRCSWPCCALPPSISMSTLMHSLRMVSWWFQLRLFRDHGCVILCIWVSKPRFACLRLVPWYNIDLNLFLFSRSYSSSGFCIFCRLASRWQAGTASFLRFVLHSGLAIVVRVW
jgi:hypothetical protein